jgi:hypothetical protein
MTKNSIIRDNLSINDGNNRKRLFNFAMASDSTLVSGNVFYNNSTDSVKIEFVDVEYSGQKNVLFERNIIHFTGASSAVFSKTAKQYERLSWKENTFKGNILGKENLLNVVNGEALLKDKDTRKYPWSLLKKLKPNK